jgi:predicted permease
MANLLQNIRFALRMLIKNPGFAVMAIFTLAIGIGANTAIFTVLNAVLLRPLPFHDPARLVILTEKSPQFDSMSVAYQNFQDWKTQNSSFESMALFRRRDVTLTGDRGPEHINGREISAGFFTLLGVTPIMGRDFQPEDDHEGAAPVVVLSYGLWQRRFGGDPNVLGKTVHLNDANYTVVGVAPRDFWFYTNSDVFTPVGASGQMWLKNREEREGSQVIGRLKAGITAQQAHADMDNIGRRLAAAYPDANAAHGIGFVPMMDDVVGDVRGTLLLLFGAVALVLLIACVNVANLLLSRVAPRQRELAVRTALGASRGRIASQLLTESILLALLGGIFGIGLAGLGTRALLAAVPGTLPRASSVGVDWHVGLFLLAICGFTGILFGLAPVWQAVRSNTNETLKESGRGMSRGRHFLQSGLVVAELAMAMLLLVCGGLTVRTLQKLGKVDPGFRPENILTFDLGFSKLHYNHPQKIRNLFHDVVERLEAVPGIEAASLTTDIMMRDDSETMFYVAERPKPRPEDLSWSMMYITGTDYLRTMGIKQIRGRFFTEQDHINAAPVIVIDEELASSLFPGQDPIGHHLIIPFPNFDQPREIIGIVQHVKHWGLAQDSTAKIRSEFYVPFGQIPDTLYSLVSGMSFAVRSRLEPQELTAAVNRELHGLDSDMPVFNVAQMNEIISASIAKERFTTLLLVFFACTALLLGAIGTYGVISYAVSQRTHEMGIRMALGAETNDILQLVMRWGLRLIAFGIVIGLGGALLASRLLKGLLYGVTSTDPLTFALVPLVLVAVAIAACYVPARRATKVNPIIALRHE